jgi:hypothetical protein
MKKTYQITFKAELTEDDFRAMNKYFYDTMNDSMEINNVWDLEMKEIDGEDTDNEIPDIKEAQKYTMHIDDVVDGLNACETIDEVRDFLDTIPRKFGEWWVDIVLDEKGMGYYEVTNQYVDINGEMQVDTYNLDIEVEEED